MSRSVGSFGATALLAAVLLATAPGTATAKTIVVDGDRTGAYLDGGSTTKTKGTIGAAVDAAGPGDTIWVCVPAAT